MLSAKKIQSTTVSTRLYLYGVQRKGKTIQNSVFGFWPKLGNSQKVTAFLSKGQKNTFLFVQSGV